MRLSDDILNIANDYTLSTADRSEAIAVAVESWGDKFAYDLDSELGEADCAVLIKLMLDTRL